MSLFGGITDLLFGKPEIPEMDEDQLIRLLEIGIDKNRYDQQGLFTNFNWDEDKGTLTQSINPQLQGGMDAMLGRVDQGSPGYGGAGRFQPLIDAYMAREQPQRRQRPDIPQRPPMERPPMQERPPIYRPQSSYPGGG